MTETLPLCAVESFLGIRLPCCNTAAYKELSLFLIIFFLQRLLVTYVPYDFSKVGYKKRKGRTNSRPAGRPGTGRETDRYDRPSFSDLKQYFFSVAFWHLITVSTVFPWISQLIEMIPELSLLSTDLEDYTMSLRLHVYNLVSYLETLFQIQVPIKIPCFPYAPCSRIFTLSTALFCLLISVNQFYLDYAKVMSKYQWLYILSIIASSAAFCWLLQRLFIVLLSELKGLSISGFPQFMASVLGSLCFSVTGIHILYGRYNMRHLKPWPKNYKKFTPPIAVFFAVYISVILDRVLSKRTHISL